MEDQIRFVAVEFENDNMLKGRFYWYLCGFENVASGDKVSAPFGKNDDLRDGVVRLVHFSHINNTPFPLNSIKYIREVKEFEE